MRKKEMASVIGNGVTLLGLNNADDYVTVNLASGITEDDEGKAVTWDASAANQMKLAGDGNPVHGYLDKVEKRDNEGILVGSVLMQGFVKFPLLASDPATYGDSVEGSAGGEVKKSTAAHNLNTVVDKGTDYVVVRLRA